MMNFENGFFTINTKHTTYAFHVIETGHLEHLYYGPTTDLESIKAHVTVPQWEPGNTALYSQNSGTHRSLESTALEASFIGKSDIREPLIEAICADGSTTLDFVYKDYEITDGMKELRALPNAHDGSKTLTITLEDKNHGLTLELYYTVFYETDCIARSLKLINTSSDTVRVERLMSILLDFDRVGFSTTNFVGGWAKEMNRTVTPVKSGAVVHSSFTGTSSSRCNPLFFVHDENASEEAGLVYGFNLMYSGNHYHSVSTTIYGQTRVVSGINPTNFAWILAANDEIEAPWQIMTVSDVGFRNASLNFHHFVRNHISPKKWSYKKRPVLLNSWEANYFDINEEKLLEQAAIAKDLGIELFVMDDGWFGHRNDDTSSLGDWFVNKEKLPNGLEGLSEKMAALGIGFGVWVEPEMICVDSELYKAHPDWAIAIPGMEHSEARNQRMLDLCNPAVRDYIVEAMTKVFSAKGVTYIKWDMNRILTDYYSPYLDSAHQQEVSHRYVLGLYEVLDNLTKAFPELLIEGCSAGGNRFDLGVLCYYPQIWGSDNTDAVCRMTIQDGYTYGYPQTTYTNHVSVCPNHQTGRTVSLETRYAVASMGNLGYELNLTQASDEEKTIIEREIMEYKNQQELLLFGDLTRSSSDSENISWSISNSDKSKVITMDASIKDEKASLTIKVTY